MVPVRSSQYPEAAMGLVPTGSHIRGLPPAHGRYQVGGERVCARAASRHLGPTLVVAGDGEEGGHAGPTQERRPVQTHAGAAVVLLVLRILRVLQSVGTCAAMSEGGEPGRSAVRLTKKGAAQGMEVNRHSGGAHGRGCLQP